MSWVDEDHNHFIVGQMMDSVDSSSVNAGREDVGRQPMLCIVGSKEPYPAYLSLVKILEDIIPPGSLLELSTSRSAEYSFAVARILEFVARDISLSFRLLFKSNRIRPSILLIFQGYYPFVLTVARLLRIKTLTYVGGSGYHTSYFTHTSGAARLIHSSNILLQNLCYQLSDQIVIPSRAMVNELQLREFESKVRFAVCIVGPGFFERFRKNIEYSKREEVIGFVGILQKRKGVVELIHSMSFLEKQLGVEGAMLEVIGNGPILWELGSEIRRLGLENSVRIRGQVAHDELPDYYNRMKLLVLPSYTEGLPSVVLEAMACGTPVLATMVGALTDVIEDSKTGFALASVNPRYMAQRIAGILGSEGLASKVSDNSYLYVRERYAYDKVLDDWRDIIGFRCSEYGPGQSS